MSDERVKYSSDNDGLRFGPQLWQKPTINILALTVKKICQTIIAGLPVFLLVCTRARSADINHML